MTSPARWQGTTLILNLHVQPGATRDEIVGLHGERLKIRIAAAPVDGQANAHLLDYLATSFGSARSAITLLHGVTGRSKTVQIAAPKLIPASVAQLLAPRSPSTQVLSRKASHRKT